MPKQSLNQTVWLRRLFETSSGGLHLDMHSGGQLAQTLLSEKSNILQHIIHIVKQDRRKTTKNNGKDVLTHSQDMLYQFEKMKMQDVCKLCWLLISDNFCQNST